MSREVIVLLIAALAGLAAFAMLWSKDRPGIDGSVPPGPGARFDPRSTGSRPAGSCIGDPYAPGGSGRLDVTALRAASGEPEAGLLVEAVAFNDASGRRRRFAVVTDERGTAVFENVPAGPVRVFAGTASRYCAVEGGGACAITVELGAARRARIRVVDASGAPIEHAAVWRSSEGGSRRGFVTGATTFDGRYDVEHPVSGLSIAVRRDGYAWSARQEIPQMEGGAPAEVRIGPFGPGRTLRGAVVDEEGRPVRGAWIGCASVASPVIEASSGADGAFEVPGLAAGDWRLEAWCVGWAAAIASIAIDASDPAPVTVVLRRGAVVRGTARDQDGRPLPRVRVSATAAEGLGEGVTATTGDDGRFRLDHVPAGRVRARAGYLAGARTEAALDLTGVESLEWNPVIHRLAMLDGVVTDSSGAGRAFARVRASSRDPSEIRVAETIADRWGRFEIPRDVLEQVEVDVPAWGADGTWSVRDPAPASGRLVIVVPESAAPSSAIVGNLADAFGGPLAGVEIAATALDDPASRASLSVSKAPVGAFRIGPVPPGRYLIEALMDATSRMTLVACEVGAHQEVDVGTRSVERAGFLKAFLTRARDAPRSQRLVVLDARSRRVGTLRPVVDFAVSGPLCPGSYVLRVEGSGVAAREIPFAIKSGETTTMDVPIEAAR